MKDIKVRIEELTKEYLDIQNYISRTNRSNSTEEIEKVNIMLDQQMIRKEEINKLRKSIGLAEIERITNEEKED